MDKLRDAIVAVEAAEAAALETTEHDGDRTAFSRRFAAIRDDLIERLRWMERKALEAWTR